MGVTAKLFLTAPETYLLREVADLFLVATCCAWSFASFPHLLQTN